MGNNTKSSFISDEDVKYVWSAKESQSNSNASFC